MFVWVKHEANTKPSLFPVPASRVRLAKTQSALTPGLVPRVGVAWVQWVPAPVPGPRARVAETQSPSAPVGFWGGYCPTSFCACKRCKAPARAIRAFCEPEVFVSSGPAMSQREVLVSSGSVLAKPATPSPARLVPAMPHPALPALAKPHPAPFVPAKLSSPRLQPTTCQVIQGSLPMLPLTTCQAA